MTSPIKLVSVTPDAEKLMAYVARVSNPNNQGNDKFARYYDQVEVINKYFRSSSTMSDIDRRSHE